MRAGRKRHLDPDARLDLDGLPEAGGERVCAFIERFCRITTGSRAGQLVTLRPFQREVVMGLYGTAGQPRKRSGYVSLPRKNAKSFLAACLALYGLVADGEEGAEVYVVAGDERQARVVFGYAAAMVRRSPELSAVVQVYRERLEHEASGSVMEPLSSDADLRQGLHPHLVICDEVHVVRRELWDAMRLGQGARERPLLLGITTPGYSQDSLAWQLTEHGRAGTDPSHFHREWTAPAGCAVTDESAWHAANPALGPDGWLSLEDFRATVRSTPEHAFRRYRLGQWTASASAWLPFGVWAERTDATRVLTDGERVCLGFDGSASGDSTALVAVTVARPHHVAVLGCWENPGDPRWRVDRPDVQRAVAEAFDRFDVAELACDPFGWRAEVAEWGRRWGARVTEYPTNVQSRMGKACDLAYTAVTQGRVTHDGDARLARHLENCGVKPTTYGDVIIKGRSFAHKIDLAVGFVVAHDRAAHYATRSAKRRRMLVVR
jgi:phage terminase large subunit-like protein